MKNIDSSLNTIRHYIENAHKSGGALSSECRRELADACEHINEALNELDRRLKVLERFCGDVI